MGLISALGLDVWVLLSQLLNFAILYWLLKKFALDSLLASLQKRQDEIAAGLKNAQEAAAALDKAKIKENALLTKARVQAKEIIDEARQTALAQGKHMALAAQKEADRIVENGERQVKIDREKMVSTVKTQLAEMVSLGVEAVVNKKIAPREVQQEYLQAALEA